MQTPSDAETLPLDADSPEETPLDADPPQANSPLGRPPPPWTEGRTHAFENITFPQILLRAVIRDF